MKTFTPEEMAQADKCDREKERVQSYAHLDFAPDSRMIETNPIHWLIERGRRERE